MALDQEERAELLDTYRNLSAEELRGQLGDDPEQDALINEVLGAGKQVELKDPAAADEPVAQAKPEANLEEEEEEEEEEEAQAAPDKPDANAEAERARQEAAAAAQAEADAAAAAEAAKVEVPKLDLSDLDAEFAERQKALDADKAEAFKKMMEGELPPEEYAAKETAYLNARDALRDDKAAAAGWFTSVHNFKAGAAADGVDYFNNAAHNDALDDWVKRLAAKGVPDDQVLAQAHKKVLAEFDIAPAAPAAPAAAAAPAKPKPAARAPDLSAIPPTLGGLPAAGAADDTGGGEFSHLDSLDGFALEQAIARLTPDQRARYEAE